MAEAATILRAAGHHAAPIPLAETMLARWLCAAGGVEAPAVALTIGPVEPEDRLHIAEAAVSGHAGYIPWGRDAAAVVLIAGNTMLVVARGGATLTPGQAGYENLRKPEIAAAIEKAIGGRAQFPDLGEIG